MSPEFPPATAGMLDAAERAIRILAAQINRIEASSRERFPQAIAIEVEVN